MKNKLVNRFKSITIEGYIVISISLICTIISLLFVIYLAIALATNNSMFGSNETENPMRFDIVMIITFSVFFLISLATFVFNLIFREFKKLPPVDKNIVHGRIVKRNIGDNRNAMELLKEHILHEDGEENQKVGIDKNKLKKNLGNKEENKKDKEQ